MTADFGTVQAAINVAESQLGVQENPALSNIVPYWRDIGRPDLEGEPWCAAFQTWVMRTAGVPFPSIDTPGGFVYCPDAITWGNAHGELVYPPAIGDLALFEWPYTYQADHVGLVTAVSQEAGGPLTIGTIEGNTPLPNGNDGVARAVHFSDILAYFRPPYLKSPAGSVGPPPTHTPIATPTMRGNMLAANPKGGSYICGPDGGVFCFDGAPFYKSLPELKITPNKPVVGMAVTPTGRGYWLVGADGGVFCFGDAEDLGALTDHSSWHAGTADNLCIGIETWHGDGTLAGGLGYALATRPGKVGSLPELYRFTGDGKYRPKAK